MATGTESGSLREEYCPSHMQVEWEVIYETLEPGGNTVLSPTFKIEQQSYKLELERLETDGVALYLLRKGPPIRESPFTSRYWAGLKRTDGTDDLAFDSRQTRLQWQHECFEEEASFGFNCRTVLDRLYLTSDGRLTFFLRMNIRRSPAGVETCNHGTPQMPKPESGSIRREDCSRHNHVDWNVSYETGQDNGIKLTSPAFSIDAQMYFFELSTSDGLVSLHLLRLGRSVYDSGDVGRYWIGLKCREGTYHPTNFSGKIDLSEDFGLWTRVGSQDFTASDLQERDMTLDRPLTFFFRMNAKTIGEELCIHDPDEVPAIVSGSLRQDECPSHKQVEWIINYQELRGYKSRLKSPVFTIGTQMYVLESICYDERWGFFRLHRLGHSVQCPLAFVRCWAGLKRCDGTYNLENFNKTLDLSEDFGLWTMVDSLTFFECSVVEEKYLKCDQSLTFFLRMNVEQTGSEICNHGATEMCPPGEGSVRVKEGRFVEWEVNYEARREYTHFSTSPVFTIGTQLYLLELCYETDGMLTLSLYRSGCSVEGPAGSVRCWAGIKSDYGMYHHKIEGVRCDLRRNCDLWTRMTTVGHFRHHDLEKQSSERGGRLTIFFLISAEVRNSQGFHDVAVQADGTDKHKHKDNISKSSQGIVDVAVQVDGNCKRGRKDIFSEGSEDLEKLREHFQLWLKHPEEGDRIRRLRMEEFQKRWKHSEKHIDDDKEPIIFAA